MKHGFMTTFGNVLGFFAGLLVVATISDAVKKATGTEEPKKEEKSKAVEWDKSIK